MNCGFHFILNNKKKHLIKKHLQNDTFQAVFYLLTVLTYLLTSFSSLFLVNIELKILIFTEGNFYMSEMGKVLPVSIYGLSDPAVSAEYNTRKKLVQK